ncbi:MAG: OmpH family outer membrane protein [Acidaminococcales bacterium]|jgi:outer membrane protein|nr:OmpH family outer membrane protein [Acidaminococcales bacterium]
MKNANKQNVKIIALAIVAFFALGIVGVAVTQTQVSFAAPSQNSAIGYIDMRRAIQSHPDMPNYQAEIQKESETLQKEFDEKAESMNDQEKQRYMAQLQQRLRQKDESLLSAINAKIEEVVKKVAANKDLSVVVLREIVIYGGTDITEDVIKAYGK